MVWSTKEMKLMMDLYKQLKMETFFIGKCKNQPGHPLLGENRQEQKPMERPQEEKQAEEHSLPEKLPKEKPLSGGNNSESRGDSQIQGTYIVGGSVFGWNFILYPSGKPVYYGATKESRRAAK
uniref:Uncharacterized protein n=1 Tax=Nelumbo nucifera TaxID=4432 RepID=A0A822ZN06_NELNU|nr:TPA_asm: hypothetical protein HUJ06_017321 [Nelumbo nucifera]